jgi:hypothetical protein
MNLLELKMDLYNKYARIQELTDLIKVRMAIQLV